MKNPRAINPERFREHLLVYTSRAYELLPRIDRPRILDLGCGTGLATLRLASLSNGTVVGVDRDGNALAVLRDRIQKQGLSERVSVVHCRIEEMPFAGESFDIIWGEGATGEIGFLPALKLLRGYLSEGGFLVLHDDAGGSLDKIHALPDAGFTLHAFFHLSEAVWGNTYFRPLEKALAGAAAAAPPYDLSTLKNEVRGFKSEPRRFASAFFLLKKI